MRSSDEQQLIQRLQAEAEDPYMGTVGLYVWDLLEERELFAHEPQLPLMMASTAKIVTIGAALSILGPGTRVETGVYTDGSVSPRGVLRGNLYIRGAGDPSIGSASHVEKFFYGIGTAPDQFVAILSSSGIRRIEGGVVVDDFEFDNVAKPTGRLGALTFDRAQAEDPGLSAGAALSRAIVRSGIPIDLPPRRDRLPNSANSLGVAASPTVADLCLTAGRRSDNFIAETLAKLISRHVRPERPASTKHGAEVVRDYAASLGVELHQIDGSGLSFKNRATSQALVTILRRVLTEPYASDFARSLPTMGETGTLHDRGRNTDAQGRVLAKTGTHLTPKRGDAERGFRSSGLVGYCSGRVGPRLAFAILQESPRSRYTALGGQERIAVALAEYASR